MDQEKMYEVVLKALPENVEQMLAMSEADLTKPENTAALAIAALNLYPADKNVALEMLAYLQGPQEVTPYEKQFLEDRFRDKDYVPRSYFKGATPENDYEPEKPYCLQFSGSHV